MISLLSIPILTGLLMLQMAVFNQMPLLNGAPDLVLLVLLAWALQKRVQNAWVWTAVGGLLVTYASALPVGTALVGYTLCVGLAQALRQRVWQAPILAMLITTFLGTLIFHAVTYLALLVTGTVLPLALSFYRVTMPSILLNLLIAIPIFAVFGDLARLVYPEELVV